MSGILSCPFVNLQIRALFLTHTFRFTLGTHHALSNPLLTAIASKMSVFNQVLEVSNVGSAQGLLTIRGPTQPDQTIIPQSIGGSEST